MGKKKRQFIDKKKAQKFTLVHRSQRDPLQADEDSAQHVLVPVGDALYPEDGAVGGVTAGEDQTKFGIYFDDDYDYLQHLRPRGEGALIPADEEMSKEKVSDDKVSFGSVLLPAEALPSRHEEDEGMLSKGVLPRGPQPDWDPDIVAAIDDDFDFDDPENVLDDNFMKLASGDVNNRDIVAEEEEDGEWETDDDEDVRSDIDSDMLLSDSDFDDSEEETKSRFTNYSMTSSIIRRTEGLKTLDDRFERIMEEYDEGEIGCIDHEEVTGNFNVNNDLIIQVVDDFLTTQKLHDLSETKSEELESEANNASDRDDEDEEDDEKIFEQFKKEPKEKWDCESIISTYSNLYNHPKLIIEENKNKIELHKRTGMPLGILSEKNKEVDEDEELSDKDVTLNNIRNKDETSEERRLRKQEVKQQRKNRRAEKKNNKQMFKNELKRQEKSVLNTVVQKGIKM